VTLGFKTFADGDVLLASEVMGYMMKQQVCVFADSTARDAAILSPEEGQFAFLRDVNQITFYNGSSWGAL
jgi:hypothetical protein